MWIDEIVEQVRVARDAHAARFNYDLEAIFRDLQQQERQSERRIVALPAKRAQNNPRNPAAETAAGFEERMPHAARNAP